MTTIKAERDENIYRITVDVDVSDLLADEGMSDMIKHQTALDRAIAHLKVVRGGHDSGERAREVEMQIARLQAEHAAIKGIVVRKF